VAAQHPQQGQADDDVQACGGEGTRGGSQGDSRGSVARKALSKSAGDQSQRSVPRASRISSDCPLPWPSLTRHRSIHGDDVVEHAALQTTRRGRDRVSRVGVKSAKNLIARQPASPYLTAPQPPRPPAQPSHLHVVLVACDDALLRGGPVARHVAAVIHHQVGAVVGLAGRGGDVRHARHNQRPRKAPGCRRRAEARRGDGCEREGQVRGVSCGVALRLPCPPGSRCCAAVARSRPARRLHLIPP
jgi:hypothetical protein